MRFRWYGFAIGFGVAWLAIPPSTPFWIATGLATACDVLGYAAGRFAEVVLAD